MVYWNNHLFLVICRSSVQTTVATTLTLHRHNTKIRETRKLESVCELQLVERKNEGRKPDKDLSLRTLKFMPRNLTKNGVKEFHLRVCKGVGVVENWKSDTSTKLA